MGVMSADRRGSSTNCRRAETRYLERLRLIRERSDARDEPLLALLDELVDSAVHQERAASRAELPAAVADACPVPELSLEVGEGRLDRDQALYFAERITGEMASFHWSVWEAAPRGWRDSLRGAAELREGWVERLRNVLP